MLEHSSGLLIKVYGSSSIPPVLWLFRFSLAKPVGHINEDHIWWPFSYSLSREHTDYVDTHLCRHVLHLVLNFFLFPGESRASFSLLPGPLDHGLRGAVEEDELGVQIFLQLQFSSLSHQEDVSAQFEDAIHTGQLLEHDRM